MQPDFWVWTVGSVVALLAGIFLAWRPLRQSWLEKHLLSAQRDFHRHREHLEARFLQLAGSSGKPRGLQWSHCEFDDAVAYARDRRTGALSAFVAIEISFEAIPGGGMEDVEAVSNVRAATAVFRVQGGKWHTDGRAIFNLNPTEAIHYFQNDLELVAQEPV